MLYSATSCANVGGDPDNNNVLVEQEGDGLEITPASESVLISSKEGQDVTGITDNNIPAQAHGPDIDGIKEADSDIGDLVEHSHVFYVRKSDYSKMKKWIGLL